MKPEIIVFFYYYIQYITIILYQAPNIKQQTHLSSFRFQTFCFVGFRPTMSSLYTLYLHFEKCLWWVREEHAMLHLYVTKHTCLRYRRKNQCALDKILGMRKGLNTEYGRKGLALSYIPTSLLANETECYRH